MKRFGAIGIFAAAVLVSTHLLAPASSPPPLRPVARAELAAVAQAAPVVEQVDEQVERLRERLNTPPAFPPPARDPFRYGSAAGKSTSRPPAPPAAAAAPTTIESSAASLPHLIAIATSVDSGAVRRKAVIAVGDDVQIVQAGDALGNFFVLSVGVDTVELADPTAFRTFKISLQ
jgi:hypothetical protein